MKKQAKQGKLIVGFYKDHGKTKPITKSAVDLKRKKFVEGSHEFKPVTVITHVRSLSEALEDLLAEIHLREDHLAVLREQQTALQAEGKVSAQVDAEIQRTSAQVRIVKDRVRGLRSQHS